MVQGHAKQDVFDTPRRKLVRGRPVFYLADNMEVQETVELRGTTLPLFGVALWSMGVVTYRLDMSQA